MTADAQEGDEKVRSLPVLVARQIGLDYVTNPESAAA